MPTDIAGILTCVNAHRGWAGECRREFYDKRMNQEVIGDVLGDEFKGYIFKISGGNDKQGFPMKQGVMTSKRVRLLLKKGSSCYRQRRKGERKRKSVRGCIVSGDIQVRDSLFRDSGGHHFVHVKISTRAQNCVLSQDIQGNIQDPCHSFHLEMPCTCV